MASSITRYSHKRSFQKLCTLLCISAMALLPLIGCSKEEEVVKKEVIRPAIIMTIEQSKTSKTSKYPGKVQALDRVEVSFEVSGKLIELAVREGQKINKGDLIARIDATDYKSRLEASEAKVNQAKAEVKRYENLLAEKVVAKSTYDVKKRNYDVAVSEMEIAKKAVRDTSLRAPFSGMIGKRFIENFQVVQAKQSIVSIQKVSAIEVIVNAPEQAMNERNRGNTELFVEFANYPGDRYPIKLKEFAMEADPQTQTYRVVLTMPNPKDRVILDGMTATVILVRHRNENSAVEVPVQAVFYDETKQAYTWKVDENLQVTKQQVAVGMMRENNITILSGLSSGDKIVTAGVQNLTEGMKIREYTGTMGE